MKQTTFLMCLLLLTIGVFAQTPIQHPKKYYVDGNGRLFWNRMLPFYLKIMATPGDTGVMLHSESTPQYVDPCFFDTEGKNPVRTIYAVDKTTMKTVVPQLEVLWEVYADGLAPKTVSAFIKSPYYKSPTQRYYGNGLVVPLKATDEMSGVENIYYSVNQANYAKYSDTIRLSTEGEYNLQYYSVDNVGNAEVPIKETFTVDLTTPATVYAIKGLSLGNIISGGTAFILTATDQLSGVAKTYYKIDEGKEILYDGKDILVSSLIDGEHTLSYYSIDKVDNRETVKSYTFYLDKLAPILASDVLGDRFIVNDQVYFSGRTKLKLQQWITKPE